MEHASRQIPPGRAESGALPHDHAFRALADHAPYAIARFDDGLRRTYVNPSFAAAAGSSCEHFLGTTVLDLGVPAVTARWWDEQLRKVFETAEPIVIPADIPPAGPALKAGVQLLPERDATGRVSHVLAVSYDQGPVRPQAPEEAVGRQPEQHALFERIVANVPAAIAYMNRDLVFQWVNGEYERLLQISADQAVGRHVTEVFKENQQELQALLTRIMHGRELFRAKAYPFTHPVDGVPSKTYWDLTYIPLYDQEGEPSGLLGMGLEVSDRIEIQQMQQGEIETLRQAEIAKDEFLSVISHELRTPLNFIMGFASVLEDGLVGPLSPEQMECTGKILMGTDRMLGVVNNLLDVSLMAAGRFCVAPERISYATLIEQMLDTMRPLAKDKQLSLSTSIEVPEEVEVDGTRILQVLSNLVLNAINYTPEHGQITVRAYVSGQGFTTEVADTGIGIKASDMPRLFTRFGQIDGSYTRAVGGLGLGLSICKTIIDSHGGDIGIRSDGPGKGSTFWYTLPLRSRHALR